MCIYILFYRHTLLFPFQTPLICILYQELHFCLDYQLSPKILSRANLPKEYLQALHALYQHASKPAHSPVTPDSAPGLDHSFFLCCEPESRTTPVLIL